MTTSLLLFLTALAPQAADTAGLVAAWGELWRRPFVESVGVFEAVESTAEARGDHGTAAMARSTRAFLYSRLHTIGLALTHLDTAMAALPPDEPFAEAFVRCTRASIRSFGGVPGAADDARLGLARARTTRAGRALGWCWHAQATVAINEARDPELILALLDSAAQAQRQAGDRNWLGITLFTQGYALQYYGHLDRAKRALAAARALTDSTGDRFARAWTLRFLGDVHASTGNWISADQAYRGAHADFQHLGDGTGLRSIRRVMASAAAAVGRLDEAEKTLAELRTAAEAAGSAEAVYATSIELAVVRWLRGDFGGSLAETERAAEYGRRTGHQGFVAHLGYSRGLHALRLGRPAEAERHLREWLASTPPSLLTDRYAARARLAKALVLQQRLEEGVAELVAAMDQLDAHRLGVTDRELRALVFQTRNSFDDPDFGLSTVAAALVRAGQAERAFALAERRRARMLADRLLRARLAGVEGGVQAGMAPSAPAVTTSALRTALGPESAMVQFLAGRRGHPSVVFLVSAGGLTAEVLPPLDDLAEDAERFSSLLASGQSADAVGRRLAERVVQPWLGRLDPGVRRIHLVPDDFLHRVPFEALPLPGGGHLVDRLSVAVVPSAGVALALQARPARTGPVEVLAFGDPRFAAEHLSTGTTDEMVYREAFDSSGGLPRLRASAREARRVAAHGDRGVTMLREGASEAFLKQVAPGQFRVIHFATHALVDERSAARTALALAPGGGEDGFLGPAELGALHLDADLIVLSACRTAGGAVIEGEGIQGLTAPLLEGGAGVVVATMWPVPDRAAAQFVEMFYRHLADGLRVGEALAAARRTRRDAGASPAEWAAFVAVGNAELFIPLRSPRNWVVPSAALAGLLALLALWRPFKARLA